MAGTSKVDIVNMALVKLGQETIADLDENNPRARTMSAIYDIVRQGLLRQFRWGFSKGRAQLASLTSTPSWGYTTEFQLPTDCLQLISVENQEDDPNMNFYNTYPQSQYVVEGRKILINETGPIKIVYVKDFEEAGDFDSAFVRAFADNLAFEACELITQSNTKKESLRADFQTSISLAIRANAIERPAQMQADTSWTMMRL